MNAQQESHNQYLHTVDTVDLSFRISAFSSPSLFDGRLKVKVFPSRKKANGDHHEA